jgi:hypothetical protein
MWLKRHCLWAHVFGEEPKRVAEKEESVTAFYIRLQIWKSIHDMIIS